MATALTMRNGPTGLNRRAAERCFAIFKSPEIGDGPFVGGRKTQSERRMVRFDEGGPPSARHNPTSSDAPIAYDGLHHPAIGADHACPRQGRARPQAI